MDQTLSLLSRGLRDSQCLLGGFARIALVRELILPGQSTLLCSSRLRKRVIKLLLPGVSFGPKLRCRLTLPVQGFDRFVLRQFGMADFRLQIVCEGLHIRQRPFRLFTGGGLCGQRGFGALQAAAGRGNSLRRPTVRRLVKALIPAQNGDWYITILDEAAAV
jgi:hypothetical protein